jgi:Mor family transcriptional regulator
MITNYRREDIQKFVKDGIAPMQVLRDYDIVKAKMEGKKIDDIMFENKISRPQVFRVLNKYGK